MTINKLIAGFESFRDTYYEQQPDFYRTLVEKGQSPEVLVIACADSRVNPSIIAKAEPGELFIVRNVANLVPPYAPDDNYHGTSAAIEFAILGLKVKHVIVLGHSHCGGIKSLCQGRADGNNWEFINSWMSIVNEACNTSLSGEEQLRHVEKAAVRVSLNNLLTFPWLKDRVDSGELTLHGWLFDLEAGQLLSHTTDGKWVKASA